MTRIAPLGPNPMLDVTVKFYSDMDAEKVKFKVSVDVPLHQIRRRAFDLLRIKGRHEMRHFAEAGLKYRDHRSPFYTMEEEGQPVLRFVPTPSPEECVHFVLEPRTRHEWYPVCADLVEEMCVMV